MGEVANLDLKTLYFIGIFVILLILILVSFVLTSRRENRLEQGLEEAINRLQQTEQSLSKIRHSLDILSSVQAEDERGALDESTVQEIKSLSSKLGKLSADCEASMAAQSELRSELMSLKDQVQQNSFTAMPNGLATPAGQVNTVIQTSQYPNDFNDQSLMQGQSMLPPLGQQRGLTPNTAISHGDSRLGGMGGRGSLGGQSPLPSAMNTQGMPSMQGNLPRGPQGGMQGGMQGNIGGFNADEDSGVFMPPHAAQSNQPYNPSETSGLQGVVDKDSGESLAPVQSSLQSQMEQRSTTIGFKPDDEGFNSNATKAKSAQTAKTSKTEINLPSMSVVAELAIDPLPSPSSYNSNDGLGSGVVEVDPQAHALAPKLDAEQSLNLEQAQAKANSLQVALDGKGNELATQALDESTIAESELSASFAASLKQGDNAQNSNPRKDKSKKSNTLDEDLPSSKLSPTEEAVLAAVNSAVDEAALFGSKPSDYDNYAVDQITPQDDERFAALNSFTNLYTNARRKQLAQEQEQEQRVKNLSSKFSQELDQDDDAMGSSALKDLNAAENPLSSVFSEQGSTIDFGQDMHFGNEQGAGSNTVKDSTRTAEVAKVVAAEEKRNVLPQQEVMSPGVLQKATVVDMIYDAEYVRKQKDQKPYGINIDTLDKAHTFIDAGVSLTEISAKTGLSEDELRLLYDVDEDGKVRNSGDMFKEHSALGIMQGQESELEESAETDSKKRSNKSKRKSLSSKGKGSLERKEAKERLQVEPNNPSAVLDKDERKEIESIMQDRGSLSSKDSASLQDESEDAFASSDEGEANKLLSVNDSVQHKQFIERIKDEEFEQNLDVIDKFADSLIKENRQKDHKRKQAKRQDFKGNSSALNSDNAVQAILHDDPHGEVEIAVRTKKNSEQSNNAVNATPIAVNMLSDLDEPHLETSVDPLNILDDFKQVTQDKSGVTKVAKYTNVSAKSQDPSGAGFENLAQNNAEYLKDFNADLDAALDIDNDEVTLRGVTQGQVSSQTQPSQPSLSKGASSSLARTESAGAKASLKSTKANQASSKNASKAGSASVIDSAKDVADLAQATLASGLNKVAELANKALSSGKPQVNTQGKASAQGGLKTRASANNAINAKGNTVGRNATTQGAQGSQNTKGANQGGASQRGGGGQVVKHYGKSQNRSSRGIENVSGVNHETYEQTYGSESYARNALARPNRSGGPDKAPEKITVDMALAQMGVSKEQRNALNAERAAKSSTAFSSVSAMNPGMSDVVDLAPMGIGSMDEKLPDDPAELLNQVVKGGLKSLNTPSADKKATPSLKSATQESSLDNFSGVSSDLGKIKIEPTKVNPGQHYANRKARNAYGMRR